MDVEDESELVTLQMEMEGIDRKMKSIGKQINDLLSRQEDLSEKKNRIQKKITNLQKEGTQVSKSNTEWNSDTFPWSAELKEKLEKHFNISNFRPLQKEAMNVTLSNKDCILIMPTGGGKSLTFQLPALVSKGFTLVVSPLVALMEDQMIALRKLNINAKMLSATTGTSHNNEVLAKMVMPSSDMKILYVTPERLAKSKRFMSKLEKAYSAGVVSRIVIDEVHCASNWGHDFRPDYQILGILKRQFPNLPILGLTATASEKILSDVKDILNLDSSCTVFRASFNRPNLFYEVYKTSLDQKVLVEDIAKRIKLEFKGMSGIIYCFSRKDSEDVASGLVGHGVVANCYHADMPANIKTAVHEGWICGRVQVVVATIAFGMGIDKPNVRFVIHFSISKSMENYYQESGRAGRDDKPAHCILYFRFQDIFRQCAMVFTEKTGLDNLHNMVRYSVDRQKCRRVLIGKHFAEQWKASECKQMCDNCKRDQDAIKEKSLSKEAYALVDILQNASKREERLTPIKLIDLWVGKGKVKDRPKETTSLPRDECEDIVTKLLVEQILTEDFHFTPYSTITYILPGPRWPLLKHGKIDVKMSLLCKKGSGKGNMKTNANSNGNNKSNVKKSKMIDLDLSNKFVNDMSKTVDLTQKNESNSKAVKTLVIDSDTDESEEESEGSEKETSSKGNGKEENVSNKRKRKMCFADSDEEV